MAHRNAQPRLQAAVAVGRPQHQFAGGAVGQKEGAGIAADDPPRAGHDVRVGRLVHRHADQARVERLQGAQAIDVRAEIPGLRRFGGDRAHDRGESGIVGH